MVAWKCHPKNERQKWTNKNWISSCLLAPLQVRLCLAEQTTVRFRICLMNRPLRSGHNEFAEDARGLVVLTHGLAVALQTISTKKSAFSYLQTCNINLVFFSLVYSSTNKGTTGKSYTSVAHGLLPSYFYARQKFGSSISAGSFIALIFQRNAVGSRINEPL